MVNGNGECSAAVFGDSERRRMGVLGTLSKGVNGAGSAPSPGRLVASLTLERGNHRKRQQGAPDSPAGRLVSVRLPPAPVQLSAALVDALNPAGFSQHRIHCGFACQFGLAEQSTVRRLLPPALSGCGASLGSNGGRRLVARKRVDRERSNARYDSWASLWPVPQYSVDNGVPQESTWPGGRYALPGRGVRRHPWWRLPPYPVNGTGPPEGGFSRWVPFRKGPELIEDTDRNLNPSILLAARFSIVWRDKVDGPIPLDDHSLRVDATLL